MLSVFVTCSSRKEAQKLGEKLVRERLVACANYFPCNSVYYWKKKLCKEKEFILLLKTIEENYSKLEKRIKQLHSYEVPCIEAFQTMKASKQFNKWVKESCE